MKIYENMNDIPCDHDESDNDQSGWFIKYSKGETFTTGTRNHDVAIRRSIFV